MNSYRGAASLSISALSPAQLEESRAEERSWLDRCAEGDPRAIEYILSKYRDRVVRVAAHVLHNTRDAEDVAQEAFIKAFRQLGTFRADSGFYAWLYRIVVNLCLDRMRRKYATAEVSFDAMPLHSASINGDTDKRILVEQLLQSLSPPMRAALVLRELEGLDYSEIAEILNIPIGTVRSRLNSAREQFRKRWAAIQSESSNV